jgi:hypothetical protein
LPPYKLKTKMGIKLAKALSILLHPLSVFAGVACAFFLFSANKPHQCYSSFELLVIVVCTLFCVLSLFVFKKLRFLQAVFRQDTKDRISTYLIFGIAYMGCLMFMDKIFTHVMIYHTLIIMIVSLIFLSIITYIGNISCHLHFWGVLTGCCTYYFPQYDYDWGVIALPVLLIIAGLLASAQIRLHLNTLAQTNIGFITGLCTSLGLLFFLQRW